MAKAVFLVRSFFHEWTSHEGSSEQSLERNQARPPPAAARSAGTSLSVPEFRTHHYCCCLPFPLLGLVPLALEEGKGSSFFLGAGSFTVRGLGGAAREPFTPAAAFVPVSSFVWECRERRGEADWGQAGVVVPTRCSWKCQLPPPASSCCGADSSTSS